MTYGKNFGVRHLPLSLLTTLLASLMLSQFCDAAPVNERYFPHGVVGDFQNPQTSEEVTAQSRIVLSVLAASGGSAGSRFGTGSGGLGLAEGRLRFYDTEGDPVSLRVNGQLLPEVGYTLTANPEDTYPSHVVYRIEGDLGEPQQFWTVLEERVGQVAGTLTFEFRNRTAQSKLTDVNVQALQSNIVNSSVALVQGSERTGLAVANPHDEPVDFWVVAGRDRTNCEAGQDCYEIVGRNQWTLPARGQTARFLSQFVGNVTEGFQGQVAVVSNRKLAALALNQDLDSPALSLSGLQMQQCGSGMVLPFAVGYLSDLLGSGDSCAGSVSASGTSGIRSRMAQAGGGAGFLRWATTTEPITSGVVVAEKDGVEHQAQISPDGAYLVGPLDPGDWQLSVRQPASTSREYIPASQPVSFPRPRLDRPLVPGEPAAWLIETLTDSTTVKPLRQMDFFFDTAGFSTPTVNAVRSLLQLWATLELPEAGLVVEGRDGTSEVLGTNRVLETGIPELLTPYTVVVQADDTVEGVQYQAQLEGTESRGGFIKFPPDCADCVQEISARLWYLLLKRGTPAQEVPTGSPPWSATVYSTQFAEDSKQLSTTILDRLHSKIVKQRPAGTEITTDLETIPKDPELTAAEPLEKRAAEGQAISERYFPHGVVGDFRHPQTGEELTAESRIVLNVVAGSGGGQTGSPSGFGGSWLGAGTGELGSATGQLRFYDTEGKPLSLRVNGQTRQQVDYALTVNSKDSFPSQTVYWIEAETGTARQFWTVVEQWTGQVSGMLTFEYRERASRIKLTDVNVEALGPSILNSSVAVVQGSEWTGLAVANPHDEPVEFWAVATRDRADCQAGEDCYEAVGYQKWTLPARGQMARFVSELVPTVGDGFEGHVAVVSERKLATVVLNQDQASPALSLSGLQVQQCDSGVALPFAVGYVSNLLGTEDPCGSSGPGNSVSASVEPGRARWVRAAGPGSFLSWVTTVEPITNGLVVLERDTTVLQSRVSADGAYLVGPLETGEWGVSISEVSSASHDYIPATQMVGFPRPRLDRPVIPSDFLYLDWLSDTLQDQLILRPLKQLEFFFDDGGFSSATVAAVKEVYQGWAGLELPELRLVVEGAGGEGEILGGPLQTGNIPPPMTPHTVLVTADPDAGEVNSELNYHWQTGEAYGGVLRFNPDCQDCVGKVVTQLWRLVFGQTPGDLSLAQFLQASNSQKPLGGTTPPNAWTTISQESRQVSATALDRGIWKQILAALPPGSKLTPEAMELPAVTPPDKPNQPPQIRNQSFSAFENTEAGHLVGTVAATDPDPDDTLAFFIVGGNSGGLFRIGPATGRLEVARAGLEFPEVYPLTVQVTDSQGATDRAIVTVRTVEICNNPTVPSLTTPADATSGQPYTVSWEATSPDNTYILQEATNSNFSGAIEWVLKGTSKSFQHSTESSIRYYYRVRAVDNCADVAYLSDWSNVEFTEVSSACVAPATPTVSAPAYVFTGHAYTVSWTAASPNDTYILQEANNLGFAGATEWQVLGTSRAFTHTSTSTARYYYRVRSIDECEGSEYLSGWSNTVSTELIPECQATPAPVLSVPPSAASGEDYTVSWSPASPDSSYDIEEATNPDFSSASRLENSGTDRVLNRRVYEITRFYYRVRSNASCGGSIYSSAWSNVGYVDVRAACDFTPAPVLSGPTNANSGASYTVSWTAIPGAVYELQEAETYPMPFSPDTFIHPLSTSYDFAHSVVTAMPYYYRVRAVRTCEGTDQYSLWSHVVVTTVEP